MSQLDYPPPMSNARPRLSAAAVTGFILSLLLCIPLVASLTAVLLSIVGLRRTRPGMYRGRGLAIAGLVIGTIGLVGWIAVGGMAAMLVNASTAPRATLHEFASKLTSGDVPAAAALCEPTTISPEDIDHLHTNLAKLGTYSDLTCYSVNISSGSSGTTCVLAGAIYFSSGQHAFNAILRKDAAGNWKVAGFHVDIAP